MTLKCFHASPDLLPQIIKAYQNNAIVPFRDMKTPVERFYDLHLKATIQHSLLLAANTKENDFVYFVVNAQEINISTAQDLIMKATLIYE